MQLSVTDNIYIETPAISDAAGLYPLIAQDRENLAKWLPWAATTQSVIDEAGFIRDCLQRIEDRQLWLGVIWVDHHPAGMIDLHDFKDSHAAIGYWLGKDYRGQGVLAQSLAALEKFGFGRYRLHKISILAEPDNAASRAVAERANYRQDGTLREHIPHQDSFADAVVYSKLSDEA